MSPLRLTERRARQAHDRGFTLIEILVAIVLVGILAGVAVIGVQALTGSGSTSACTASADAAKAATNAYYAAHAGYPTDFVALTSGTPALLVVPSGGTVGTTTISTRNWTLTLTPGANATVGPTFSCASASTTTTTTTGAGTGLTASTTASASTTTTTSPTTARTTTTTVSPTTTTTTTSTTTTTTTAVAVAATVAPEVPTLPAGVSLVATISGDGRYFLEWDVALTNKVPITGMSLTITVADDGSWKYHGMWANLWGGTGKGSASQADGSIVYQFDLLDGQKLVEGSWTLAGQADGVGKPHTSKGDSWTLIIAAGSSEQVFGGTFG